MADYAQVVGSVPYGDNIAAYRDNIAAAMLKDAAPQLSPDEDFEDKARALATADNASNGVPSPLTGVVRSVDTFGNSVQAALCLGEFPMDMFNTPSSVNAPVPVEMQATYGNTGRTALQPNNVGATSVGDNPYNM